MNQIFRDYQLVTQLARKATSRLYLAHPIAASTENVVIRIFDPIPTSFAQERFQHEVNQFIQLRHPFILPLLSGGLEQGHPYLVSGYAPGDSLRNRIGSVRPRPFPLAKALLTIVQLGQALAYAHAWNIWHANIKPENVLFDAKDQALLTDFIPSSLIECYFSYQQSGLQDARYKAPEQLVGMTSLESDQYALGCIAYEILTGQPPFTVIALPTGQFKRTAEHPTPLTDLVPDIPQHVDAAICRALANEPRERHASVAAFMEALTAYPLKVTTAITPEGMMSAPAMEELTDSSLLGDGSEKASYEPFMGEEASTALPANRSAMGAGMNSENTEAGILAVSSPMPVMPPPLIPQTPHYLHRATQDTSLGAKSKSVTGEKAHPRRKRLAIGMGVVLALLCLLVLGVSILPQLFPPANAKQSYEQTPTVPAITATVTAPAQETPTATPTLQPTATPTATPTPSPTPSPTATPQPTATPSPPEPTPTPTPKPRHTPTPTPTPCRCGLFCWC